MPTVDRWMLAQNLARLSNCGHPEAAQQIHSVPWESLAYFVHHQFGYQFDVNLLTSNAILNEVFSGLHALCPLRPASVVDSSVCLRIAGFREGCIHNSSSDSSPAAADDWLRGVHGQALEYLPQLGGRQKRLVLSMKQVACRDIRRPGHMSRHDIWTC
jgi:hypothetical protein